MAGEHPDSDLAVDARERDLNALLEQRRLAREMQTSRAAAENCIHCGGLIPVARRQALANVRTCVECSKKYGS